MSKDQKDGFVFSVTPEIPTEKMIEAGADALTSISPDNKAEALRCYSAMLKTWEIESAEFESLDENVRKN